MRRALTTIFAAANQPITVVTRARWAAAPYCNPPGALSAGGSSFEVRTTSGLGKWRLSRPRRVGSRGAKAHERQGFFSKMPILPYEASA